MIEIDEFIKDRREALLSLDENKIKAFMKKNKSPIPRKEVFWISVHKAITGATDLPIEFRARAKAWLNERGYQSLDDGEL